MNRSTRRALHADAHLRSLTGHSLGATGVQEAIYCLLMMQNGFICESANIDEIDPAFADMPIARNRIDNVEVNTVLSNSFGFGGTNATLVLQRSAMLWSVSPSRTVHTSGILTGFAASVLTGSALAGFSTAGFAPRSRRAFQPPAIPTPPR